MNIFKERVILLVLLISIFNSALSQPQGMIDSIRINIQNFQYLQASKSIQQQLALYPESSILYYYKGLALKGLMKYPEAIKSFSSALEKQAGNFQIMMEIENCYKMTGNINKAISIISGADSLVPGLAVKQEMAGLYYAGDRFIDALVLYTNLLKEDSSNVFLLRNIGKCYEKLDVNDSALAYYEKASRLNPLDFQSVYNACLIYIKKRKYVNGISLTGKFISLDSTDIRINRMNAYNYLLNRSYDTALNKFVSCLKTNDTVAFIYKYLGMTYFKVEKYDSALKYLARAYILDTTDAQTCNFLGLSCLRTYYKKKGIEYINKAIQLTKPDPVYLSGLYKNLAEGYIGFYKPREALEALLNARQLNPKDTLLIYKIAWQYDSELKKPEQGLVYYQEFLKTKPGTDSIPLARKIMFAYSVYDEKLNKQLDFSFYDLAKKRVKEIQEWMKTKSENKKK